MSRIFRQIRNDVKTLATFNVHRCIYVEFLLDEHSVFVSKTNIMYTEFVDQNHYLFNYCPTVSNNAVSSLPKNSRLGTYKQEIN
jgi:hypothetical protein